MGRQNDAFVYDIPEKSQQVKTPVDHAVDIITATQRALTNSLRKERLRTFDRNIKAELDCGRD